VVVADLGFCYADSRQTGGGNDSKTFFAWRTTLEKHFKTDLKTICSLNFGDFFLIFFSEASYSMIHTANTNLWLWLFFLDAISKKLSWLSFKNMKFFERIIFVFCCRLRVVISTKMLKSVWIFLKRAKNNNFLLNLIFFSFKYWKSIVNFICLQNQAKSKFLQKNSLVNRKFILKIERRDSFSNSKTRFFVLATKKMKKIQKKPRSRHFWKKIKKKSPKLSEEIVF
jgi:hypothetical protein